MRTTFINQNSEGNIREAGKQSLINCAEDFEYFMNFCGCEDIDDLRECLRDGNFTFSEMRQAIKTFENVGSFYDYGLCFDFVEVDTFPDLDSGYYRYQLSWGGPGVEIRFYPDGLIEFVYLDWFCGIGFDVSDEDWAQWLLDFFTDVGSIDFNSIEPEQLYNYENLEY